MVESPELVRISLKLYDFTVEIQGVFFNGCCPSELNYDMSVSLSDIPLLDESSVQSHLKALLYEIPDSPSGFTHLDHLTKEAGHATLAVFSEPSQEFGNVYLIGRSDDRSFGSTFSGSKFGLFVYHYKEILGEDPSNYVSFIRLLKIAKSSFIQKTQKKFEELEDKKEEKRHFEELSEYLTKRSERLKEELETAKQAIQQLNYQLEKKRNQVKERQEQNLECIVCKSCMKDVVFLPCGHIIVCKTCMIETMNVQPGTVVSKRNPVKCPLCKNPVKESKEIHF
jgi:rubrerythrin